MSQSGIYIPTSGPGSGTVTSIAAGTGITLTPNPLTTTGTVALTIPVTVVDGGSGAQTFTAHGVLLGEGTSHFGVTAVGTTGQVLTGVSGADPVWASPAASSISITGDSGGALTGAAFTFTGASTGLTFSGSGSTETLTGTLIVGNGGTGAATFTTHGVLLGEGTSHFGVTAAGTTGQLLTGVTGADPVWASPAASSISITGDSGGALTGSAFTFTGASTGLTFSGSGSTETLTGTLIVGNGGTGAATLTGLLLGNGTSAVTGITAGDYGVLISSSAGVPSWLANGTTGQILTATTSGTPSWENVASSSISITGDSGGGLTGHAFTFTGGTTGLTFAGSVSTETLGGTLAVKNGGTGANTLTGVLTGNGTSAVSASAVTQYDVLVGGASNAVSSVGPGTALQVLQSGGNAANPAYSTATYPATTTVNQLLYSSSNNVIGGVTAGDYGVLISSSAGVPSWLANGTTGQVLTATTSGTPSWENSASGGITTIDGDTGSITGSTVTIKAGLSSFNCGSSVKFVGSSATMTFDVTDSNSNTIIGNSSGKAGITGTNNTGCGVNQYLLLTSGSKSCALGSGALSFMNTGTNNIGIGYGALSAAQSSSWDIAIGDGALSSLVTTGTTGNVAIGGNNTLAFLSTGTQNICIGYNTGGGYTAAESSNILLNSGGVGGESNTLRIGAATGPNAGDLNKSFICGINGITVTGSAVLVSSGDQLGVAVSSRRFKENIEDMGLASSGILKLRPVTFNYTVGQDFTQQAGLIAEEVNEIMPSLVVYDKSGDPQTVKYHDLPALLLNELQKAVKRIEVLEAKLAERK